MKKTNFNRNSYVTAALFVVFVILTGVYWTLDDVPGTEMVSNPDPAPGVTTTIKEKDTDAESTEVDASSALDHLRLELEVALSKKESELEGIVASSTHTQEQKDEAKQELDDMSSSKEHADALEATIRAKGYEGVLVRVNEEAVQVVVEIENEEAVPTTSEINELYILAKTEFANDPYVTIKFQPIN